MATSWKSQQGKVEYALQFEADDEGKYKLVEKAAQMAMDGKTVDDLVEVKHGEWILLAKTRDKRVLECSNCKYVRRLSLGETFPELCEKCGTKMDGRSEV